MSKTTQENMRLSTSVGDMINVEKYDFEPIKGYPMLNWRGKRPFTSTQYYPAQLKEVHGEEDNGWRNKIYWGDNLQVMSHLLKEFRGKVDLIYIDPPFDSKADYNKKIKIKGQTSVNAYSSFEEKQYTDIWANDDYLQFMYERLALMRELLSPKGALIVHVDQKQVHRVRIILDELFGIANFRNEIIWHYGQRTAAREKKLDSKHDNLLLYTKSDEFSLNEVTIPWSYEDFVAHRHDIIKDENGEEYVLSDAGNGQRYRRYVKDIVSAGKPLDTVWDLPLLNSSDGQRTGYPTQKPDYLLERIVKLASKPGELVFDCFMGSGTTQAVAMKLGRRFIGADINLGAIQTTTKRLIKAADEIKQTSFKDTVSPTIGFEIYNVNHYDIFRNPLQAKELLLEALEVHKLEFSAVFDGEKDGRMVKVMPVNRITTRADLNELISGFDYKSWERKQNESPNRPVEKITLVCMGHEPDLAAQLELAAKPFKIDVEVVDILRDKADLEFKRDSKAKISIENSQLVIEKFYPMNLLQKLSLQTKLVEDWKELVESVLIDWNYDGAVLQPTVIDIPGKNDLVIGAYKIPEDAGTIRVKITDLLSESWEGELING